jgi:hypothetical protein
MTPTTHECYQDSTSNEWIGAAGGLVHIRHQLPAAFAMPGLLAQILSYLLLIQLGIQDLQDHPLF